jgi:chaperonin cofactor prefoldin
MIETQEGYLICKNVKIARTGWMDYHGQDLPTIFDELPGTPIKVYRSPEEVFSETTLASFEGKAVTNTHPNEMLDINTTPMIERGHAQNVRRDGEYIIADLFIKEAGLISEIQNNLKREVSCGYDCSWHKIGDRKYEQRDITGNHVAVVRNGRAGPRVAIKDQKPEGGIIKNMKITSRILQAVGFQKWAADADPEEVAKAIDELSEEKPDKVAPPVKDSEEEEEKVEKSKAMDELTSKVDSLTNIINQLVKTDKETHNKFGAKKAMDKLEEELVGKAADDDDDDDDDDKGKVKDDDDDDDDDDSNRKSAKGAKDDDDDDNDKKKGAADEILTKFVKDMKPVIMSIKDENTRNKVAKKFVQSVRDARGESCGSNSYADILTTVNKNRQNAVTDSAYKNQNMAQGAEIACNAWKAAGDKMNGGLK